jgi:hypothetical protein
MDTKPLPPKRKPYTEAYKAKRKIIDQKKRIK